MLPSFTLSRSRSLSVPAERGVRRIGTGSLFLAFSPPPAEGACRAPVPFLRFYRNTL